MTRAQDRARERRRAEKLAGKIAARQAEARRNRKAVALVVLVLAVVVGFVWLTSALTKKSATPTAGGTTAAETTAAVLAGCTQPPAKQATPKTFSSAPDFTVVRGKTYTGTVTTSCGKIGVELYGAKAPKAVASFAQLAKAGYWAPSPCHRLTTSGLFVLQCGDPTGTGSGPGPGYTFGVENAPADGKYPRGTLAMARTTDPNSNGGQFFIVYKDTDLPTDGGGYTIFGRVTSGLDIVERIAAAGVDPQDKTSPKAPISILSVDTRAKA